MSVFYGSLLFLGGTFAGLCLGVAFIVFAMRAAMRNGVGRGLGW